MGKRKRTWGSVILPVCVLLSVYIVFCAVVDPEQILPRTSVDGVPLGGKTEEEAARMLEEEVRSRREEAVLTGWNLELIPAIDQDLLREAALSGDHGKVLSCPAVESAAEPMELERIHEEIYEAAVNAALDPENGYEINPPLQE